MSAETKDACCPHCLSGDGYTTKVVMTSTRVTEWSGKSEDVGPSMIVSETSPRCFHCRRSVRAHLKRIATQGSAA